MATEETEPVPAAVAARPAPFPQPRAVAAAPAPFAQPVRPLALPVAARAAAPGTWASPPQPGDLPELRIGARELLVLALGVLVMATSVFFLAR
jgi:hypothetical protein